MLKFLVACLCGVIANALYILIIAHSDLPSDPNFVALWGAVGATILLTTIAFVAWLLGEFD